MVERVLYDSDYGVLHVGGGRFFYGGIPVEVDDKAQLLEDYPYLKDASDEVAVPNVVSVEDIAQLDVEYGTVLGSVGLPETVEATLDKEGPKSVGVEWDGGTPAYDENTAGAYEFEGTLSETEGITNNDGVKAKVTVVVAEDVEALAYTETGEHTESSLNKLNATGQKLLIEELGGNVEETNNQDERVALILDLQAGKKE